MRNDDIFVGEDIVKNLESEDYIRLSVLSKDALEYDHLMLSVLDEANAELRENKNESKV